MSRIFPPSSREPAPAAGGAPALSQQLAEVAQALQAILAGQSGTQALSAVPQRLRPGVQALLFQVLRQLGRAQALRAELAPRTPPPRVNALLCTALALAWDETQAPYPPFTLVNQAVEAAKRGPAQRQAAFINACLRRFLRERDALVRKTDSQPQALWNHPQWWIERLKQDHPAHWQQILAANNRHAPMTLRVNRLQGTVEEYRQLLSAQQLAATPVGEDGLELAQPQPVQALPGFAQGQVSVQDAAAQMAAPLLLAGLDLARPLRVLDACAAPGGKTAHLLEYAGADMGNRAPLQVTALEIDPERSQRIHETLERVGVKAQVLVADAARPEQWWPQAGGAQFDAILLDAPCTASGIVRRHPDVRWLRRESDVAQLAAIQSRLLDTLWPLLRDGGRMLYCTCSVFRAEGDQQVKAFLARNSQARLLPSPGHLIPGNIAQNAAVPDNQPGDHDGFFYALLEKTA
ncbi:16S rRNA (cytosine(967)-C(5))-methyltransferase RsmB [Comamonas endophytica]|uniref:16S rRNA (cytosine(967)-C(5))-methyltransferase n=1 Tax=Comamonas endophytica TaxID=2949090 RepID=A0ABY6GD74_9BURK|nr:MULTISPECIES: 16S rRNA (cytosine(967)-C(5))-methyltransferase RsmB [unclassified Acidovorax]MCD2512668.1 16S rRNA (cytosine(967)-C(5))-methyltransferase RsmB [Acidovorax sp. D4N7]UYG52974.1 16S rRNA (cytosine(967)-C(5))-methyltransferase RsmB [Acidovorax sp. 5MLIR]